MDEFDKKKKHTIHALGAFETFYLSSWARMLKIFCTFVMGTPWIKYFHALYEYLMYVLTWSKPSCVELDADVENFNLNNVDESLNLPLLNESQQKAVEEAMKKPFTVIQGPPGIKILYNMCPPVFLSYVWN